MPGPYDTPAEPLSDHLDTVLQDYCAALTTASQSLYTQVTSTPPPGTHSPPVAPGDWVWIKAAQCSFPENRWKGPYKVLSATPFSVSIQGREGGAHWYHLSRARKADPPGDQTTQQTAARIQEAVDPPDSPGL